MCGMNTYCNISSSFPTSMQAIQNLGLAIITIVAGVIVDKSGYLILEVFFLANLCVALIAGRCGWWVWF